MEHPSSLLNNEHPSGSDSFSLERELTGVIYKKTAGGFSVRAGNRTITCTLAARLRKRAADDLTVGDEVRLVELGAGNGQIVAALPRRSLLARRSAAPMPSAATFEQVIAANVDQVVPVFAAAHPAPHWNLLDRYLVAAEAAGLPALVCITKLDLASLSPDFAETLEDYRRIGYGVVRVSAFTGQGLDEFKAALQGRLSVMVGKSGVGKTSLLNALQPGLGLRVSAVSQATGKGRHTTTHLEMFPLEGGGAIVDTPGVREFGLWDVEEDDLAQYFPEMRPYIGCCKFGLGCRHDEEPGCAVRKAVMSGQISPRRYQSYSRLKEDFYQR